MGTIMVSKLISKALGDLPLINFSMELDKDAGNVVILNFKGKPLKVVFCTAVGIIRGKSDSSNWIVTNSFTEDTQAIPNFIKGIEGKCILVINNKSESLIEADPNLVTIAKAKNLKFVLQRVIETDYSECLNKQELSREELKVLKDELRSFKKQEHKYTDEIKDTFVRIHYTPQVENSLRAALCIVLVGVILSTFNNDLVILAGILCVIGTVISFSIVLSDSFPQMPGRLRRLSWIQLILCIALTILNCMDVAVKYF